MRFQITITMSCTQVDGVAARRCVCTQALDPLSAPLLVPLPGCQIQTLIETQHNTMLHWQRLTIELKCFLLLLLFYAFPWYIRMSLPTTTKKLTETTLQRLFFLKILNSENQHFYSLETFNPLETTAEQLTFLLLLIYKQIAVWLQTSQFRWWNV